MQTIFPRRIRLVGGWEYFIEEEEDFVGFSSTDIILLLISRKEGRGSNSREIQLLGGRFFSHDRTYIVLRGFRGGG